MEGGCRIVPEPIHPALHPQRGSASRASPGTGRQQHSPPGPKEEGEERGGGLWGRRADPGRLPRASPSQPFPPTAGKTQCGALQGGGKPAAPAPAQTKAFQQALSASGCSKIPTLQISPPALWILLHRGLQAEPLLHPTAVFAAFNGTERLGKRLEEATLQLNGFANTAIKRVAKKLLPLKKKRKKELLLV